MPVPVERPCPYLANARLCSSRTPVPVDIISKTIAKYARFGKTPIRQISTRRCELFDMLAERSTCYFCLLSVRACGLLSSYWVALSAKRILIFSVSKSFVEIRDCTPLYADSFDLNARHSQVSFAGMHQHFRQLPIVVARFVLVLSAACFRICRMPVLVCLGRSFVHLWTPVRAFVGRPYLYPCVQALGGNFIMTCTVGAAILNRRHS